MCSNFCLNNVHVRTSIPIETHSHQIQVENKLKAIFEQPSRNFLFVFHQDPDYFTIECSTKEDKQHLHDITKFNVFIEINDSIRLHTFGIYKSTAIHDFNCYLYLIQRKDQVLTYNKHQAIRTRVFKKLQRIVYRNQIINEEKISHTFENTKIITYNEDFEFDSREFEQLTRQSNIYKVYQTDAIAVKFKPIYNSDYRPDLQVLKWLFEKPTKTFVKSTKQSNEEQLYVIQASSFRNFNELIHDLESGHIYDKIYRSNRDTLAYSTNEDTQIIPSFTYDIIYNWEFFCKYIQNN